MKQVTVSTYQSHLRCAFVLVVVVPVNGLNTEHLSVSANSMSGPDSLATAYSPSTTASSPNKVAGQRCGICMPYTL